jgi:hypothetical protein
MNFNLLVPKRTNPTHKPDPISIPTLSGTGKKNPASSEAGFACAQDWIRTSTPLRALPPQSSASTNFATWALRGCKSSISALQRKDFHFRFLLLFRSNPEYERRFPSGSLAKPIPGPIQKLEL